MKSFLTSLLLWLPLLGRSQTPVQVVTKVIEKSLPYTDGQLIQINAQKADVTLKGNNQSTVSVKLRLIAKHTDRTIAEREVAYHQYALKTENGQIELSNRFVIPQRAGKLQSQLKAIYEISVPAKSLIALTNSFGNMLVSDLIGAVNLKFEFGKLTLVNTKGKLTITSSYGDIESSNLDAALNLQTEKADVLLRDLSGAASLQCRYGKLTVLPTATLDALTIEATRTDILVIVKRLSDFRFDLAVSSADIRVPEELSDLLSKHGSKQHLRYLPQGRRSDIRIQNSYGNIVLQDEKSLVNR